MKKKLLSSFMAVCMILTMLPTAAFAAASTAPDSAALTNNNETLTVVLPAAPAASDVIKVYDAATDGTLLQTFTITTTATSQEITLNPAATGEVYVTFTSVATSTAESARVVSTGYVAPTYAVTITVNKDGAAWSDHGKAITLKKGTDSAITDLTSVPNGTYKILVDTVDTGETVTVSGAAATATLNYYTVAFAVTDVAPAANSTIAATYDSNAITSGNVVLGGKELVITATGAGASTYTYAWTGDGTNNETSVALTISNLSAAVNASCAVTGAAAPTYAVTITVNKDGSEWTNHGKTITLQKDSDQAIGLTSVPDGTYKILVDTVDTGETVTVSGAAATATLDYYTVTFAVTDVSPAANSTIAATYGGASATIQSGDVVLGGKELVITATGAGASTYTYAWTGAGTNNETSAALTISNLSAAVNASCAVTGAAAPTYAVTITVNKDGAAWSDHGKAITLQKGSEQAITNLNSVPNGTYKILVDGADTGETVTVNGAAANATLDYYTVTFAVTDVAPAANSTIAATYGGASATIQSGDVVLGGKELVITATGAGASTYTYAWTGDGTKGETTAALTISNLSAKVNATCTVTGTGTVTPPTTGYAVTITVNKDGTVWSDHTKAITLQKDSEQAITDLTSVPNGTYKILVDDVDTGKTVVVNGAAATATLDYYTVAFTAADASDASGSSIAATYDSVSINTNDVVLGGKKLVITATGAGASTYTYAWTGDGTNNETIAVLTINSLSAKVNATCTVTGTGTVTPPVAATIATTSEIVNGATGVTVTVTSDKAFDATAGISNDNWTIDAGTTGLTLSSVALDPNSSGKTATLTFTGTAAEGTLKIKAAVAAFASSENVDTISNEITVTVPKADVTPPTDETAPVLSATSATNITATGATLNFTSDEAGTYYYLVLAAADAAPNATTIKAQGTAVAKGTDTATASANTATVTGLTAATAYKAYVIVEDSAANISDVASIAITTTAAPSPFSITEIGAASAGGVGMKRTITVDGPFTGAQYLVVQHTEGSGETAKVTATCIQLQNGATTVEVSSQTTSVVRALITSGMPNLTGTGDFGVTVYADKTSS